MTSAPRVRCTGKESAAGRRGAVKGRSQFLGPGGHHVKRDTATGRGNGLAHACVYAYAEVDGIHAWASEVSGGIVIAGDGRLLCYEEVGDPAGVPIVVIHGTPGCRLSGRHPEPARVTAAGLRLVSYDRPGYGQSSRHRGRDVVDCVADVATIAEHLGLDRFAVTSGSGGGLHALAVAARLPDRVTRVACFVGAAPL